MRRDSREMLMAVDPSFPKELKKGQLVLLTSGSYSDYSIYGLYEVLEDLKVPYHKPRWSGDQTPDFEKLTVNLRLREITYLEITRD